MTEGLQWLEMRKCGSCGKDFAVLYPQLWKFKRRTGQRMTYFCSWECVREFDQKRSGKMAKREQRDRIEIAKKIIEMANAGQGGAPVTAYLESLGYKNPVQAVHDIKMYVKEHAPEIYDQWPMRINGKRTTIGEAKKEGRPVPKDAEEIAKSIVRISADGISITPRGGIEDFEMMSVKSKRTGFRYEWSKEFDLFTIRAGGDELTLCLEDMRKLFRETPEAAAVLGVKL